MSTCEICGSTITGSHYHLPAEIKDANKIKFAHMECCSIEELKKSLLEKAQNQVKMYQDVIELVNNISLEKINDFETKYGTYEETSQGRHIDHNVMICALISELKRKITNPKDEC